METSFNHRKKSKVFFRISLVVFICFLTLSLAAIPFALSNTLPHIPDNDDSNKTCTICDDAVTVAQVIKSLLKKLILIPAFIVCGAMLCLTTHFGTSANDHTLIHFKTRLNN
jgi:hypothetical protein